MTGFVGHNGKSVERCKSSPDGDDRWEFAPESLKANPRFIRVYASRAEVKRAFETHHARTDHVYRTYRAEGAKNDSDKGEWLPIPDTIYTELALSKDALILAEKKIDRDARFMLLGMGMVVIALIGFGVWYFASSPKLPVITIPENASVLTFHRHSLREGNRIANEALFVLHSSEPVVVDYINRSPLQENVPEDVASDNTLTPPSMYHAVVLQDIPTEVYSSYYFEGSVRADNFFAGIYRHIPRTRIILVPVQMIESLFQFAGYIIGSRKGERMCHLYVDNALQRSVRVCLDGKVGPRIPATHQMRVVFRPGERNLTIVEDSRERRPIETFTADFHTEDKKTREWYVFNIGGTNSYTVTWVDSQDK